MSQPDTKERILDAAQKLFAREGFHNTSLRAITSEAGANLAAVNYHFGSKEALLGAIFERRLVPLNELRSELLQAAREAAGKEGRKPNVEEVLRAFIEPTLSCMASGPGGEDFAALVGRTVSEPDEKVRGIFLRLMEPVFALYYEALREALPDLPKDLVFWRFRFAIGAMSHAICMPGRAPVPPEGLCDSDTLMGMLIPFVVAGMETT